MIEAKYAKALAKIARDYRGNKIIEKELGTFRSTWDLTLTEIETKSNKHNDFSNRVLNELAVPIAAYVKEKENTRKKLVKNGQTLTKEYKDALDALAKAKATYVGRCKDADTATGQYQKAKAEGSIKPKELNKLNSKSAKATDSAMTANSEYRKFLKKANEKQSKFYEKEMPKLLSEFQDFEEERIRTMKSNFSKYSSMESEFPPVYDRSAKSLVDSSDGIDVKRDIETFLIQNKTGQSVLPEIPYEPYTPTNPNQDFGGTDSPISSSTSSPMIPKSTSVPTSRAVDSHDHAASTDSYSGEGRHEQLQKQLEELRSTIKEQVKSKKGLEKLVKFYASDPVAQERANRELEDQKEKIQSLKNQAAEIERELGISGDSTPRQDESQNYYQEPPHAYNDPTPDVAQEAAEEPGDVVTAVALYSYEATNESELSFKENDILTVTERDDSGWWYAELDGQCGFVPANYLQVQE